MECEGGIASCGCARKNDIGTRIRVQGERNKKSMLEPIDLTYNVKEGQVHHDIRVTSTLSKVVRIESIHELYEKVGPYHFIDYEARYGA